LGTALPGNALEVLFVVAGVSLESRELLEAQIHRGPGYRRLTPVWEFLGGRF